MAHDDLPQDGAELVVQGFDDVLLQHKPPDLLFHYTDQNGLLGILNTGELWATKVQYMNDSTEWRLAVELAKKMLTERLSTSIEDAKVQKLLQSIKDHLGRITNVNICSVSFCCNGDLLSQWRGYSGASSGLAIGFRFLPLSRIAWRDGGSLRHCIYTEKEQRDVINVMIDEAIRQVVKLVKIGEGDFLHMSDNFGKTLLHFGVFFKDCSFKEEKEWRLATYITGYSDEKFCFRPGKSMLIPYYKILLRQETWRDEIAAVTIGPCPHCDLAKLSVDGLLYKHGITDGQNSVVSCSKIPYRNW